MVNKTTHRAETTNTADLDVFSSKDTSMAKFSWRFNQQFQH